MPCQTTRARSRGSAELVEFTVEVVATGPLPEGQAKRREALVRDWLTGDPEARRRGQESRHRRKEERLRRQVARLQQELQTLEARR